jgi:hypothetical protein
MKKNQLLTTAAVLLIALGILMIFLGTKAGIYPPTITGAGFLVIAIVFLGLRNK